MEEMKQGCGDIQIEFIADQNCLVPGEQAGAQKIEHLSCSECARDPSAPTPRSNSSNACRGAEAPPLPTAGIPAHLSAALSRNWASELPRSSNVASACCWPTGTHNLG